MIDEDALREEIQRRGPSISLDDAKRRVAEMNPRAADNPLVVEAYAALTDDERFMVLLFKLRKDYETKTDQPRGDA
jgi:hypothetical protein